MGPKNDSKSYPPLGRIGDFHTQAKNGEKTAKQGPKTAQGASARRLGPQHSLCQGVLLLHVGDMTKTPRFTRFFSPTRALVATSRDKRARKGHGWGTLGATHLGGHSPLEGDKRG